MPRVVTTLDEAEHQLLRLESARTGKPQCEIVKDALRDRLVPLRGARGVPMQFHPPDEQRERVRVIGAIARPLRRLVKAGHGADVVSLLEDLVTKHELGDVYAEG